VNAKRRDKKGVKKREGRKKTGRSATITPRDDAIMLALFLCRYLSTAELAILFFNSKSAARRRLAELANKGYLEPRSLYATMPTWDRRGKCENVWHLTKMGFETVAESLGLDDERYVPKQLGQEGAVHHVKTAEVYVAAKADLDEILGPYPAWSWEHEKRAQDSYRYSGRLMGHQPDAHVRFADHLFVVERQTRESRVGPKAIDDKVSSHATYARVRLDEPDKMDVLFACDDKRVAELAERAGKRYGVDVIAGSVEHVAYYLYQSALRLAPEAGESVRVR
jgi:Replication-relaxation